MSEPEAHLFALLDKAMAEPGVVPIATLQEKCVQVPHLSLRLTGRQRYQLYHSLLLDKPPEVVVETFQSPADEADDTHKAVALELKKILCDGGESDDSELLGFLSLFAAKTGCHFDEEMTAITLTLATMVADSGLPVGTERLRRLYQLLEMLYNDFVVRRESHVFDGSLEPLLRLLLQYHDPIFSFYLDQRQVSIGSYMLNWVRRLFVGRGNYRQALIMWDWLLIVGDPSLTVYFALSYLITHRRQFLELQTKEELTEALESLDFVLPTCKQETVDPGLNDGRPLSFVALSSGKSLAQSADIAYRKTPSSTRRVIDCLLFPDKGNLNRSAEALAQYYSSWVALPLERSDFAESFSTQKTKQKDSAAVNYIMVDCRSRESFHFARLPTAIHVGDDIGYDNEKLGNVVTTLGSVRGAHLCIFGTGRSIIEESNLLKMFSLHLVHCGFPYISIGGFRSIVPLIKACVVAITRTPAEDVRWRYVSDSAAALKNGITDILPQLDFDAQEARRKAEELGSKAKDHVLAAKSWGLGVMQRMGERLSFNKNNNGASDRVGQANTVPKEPVSTTPLTVQQKGKVIGEKSEDGAPRRHSSDAGAGRNTFSLGADDDEDDEDDFGLITNVTMYAGTTSSYCNGEPLLKGSVVGDSSPILSSLHPSASNAVAVPSLLPPSSATAVASKDIMAEIDEEFDKLFGDSEEPTSPAAGGGGGGGCQ